MIIPADAPAAVACAAQALARGALLGLPTETVYGLAADASQDAAVAGIFAAKGRPADHPLIVHVAADEPGRLPPGVLHFAADDLPHWARALMHAFWPGPLTLIVHRRAGVAAAAAGRQYTIGLRCPAHPVAQAVLHAARELGVHGVAAPSANQFGRVSPTTAAHVAAEFGPELLVLDGGPCTVGIESTIVDCSRGAPVLLRPGGISRAAIETACGMALRLPQDITQPAPRASGTLASHYAPRATVRLMDAASVQTALDVLGDSLPTAPAGLPAIAVYARAELRPPSSRVVLRRMPDDPVAAAQALFAVLRELDDLAVRLIWVETPPDTPAWEGVRDRLQRAAA